MRGGSIRQRLAALAAGVALAGVAGCGLFSAARIADITPGQSIQGGDLDCWLTLEFDEPPAGIDPRDVRVRFESIALVESSEFDWAYISENDVVSAGSRFGSGYHPNEATTADAPPPPGMPIRARFKLEPRARIENPPDTLTLEAHLYWGGEHQDSARRTIEHVYASSPNGFL